MEQLLEKIKEAYADYGRREFEKGQEPNGSVYGLMYTSIFKVENDEEYDLQVSYDVEKQENIVEVSNGEETFIYREKSPLDCFLEELNTCDWEAYYHYAQDIIEHKFNQEDMWEF